MVLKIDQMFEKSFENQERNFMEMIFNARTKRNNHLKFIHLANKKAKKEKKSHKIQKRNFIGGKEQPSKIGDSN